ncbi:MAG TPA: MupA/Atu3671 family FMN-dependent luciferase-like monooxygenase [Polyangiales bacterium]|nr:MupA/Atu3671 family FMN-dependent luciferase-like monooxygenase [Polyangiales bacterium]
MEVLGIDRARHHQLSNLLDVLRFRAGRNEGTLSWCGHSGALEETLSMPELLRAASGIAAAAGLELGDRVALILPPGLGYVRAFFGAIAGGFIPVPLYPPDRAASERTLPRLEAILANANASAVWTNAQTAAVLDRLAPAGSRLATTPRLMTDQLTPCDDTEHAIATGSSLAFLQYTSGSTSAPRGVRITHANLLHNSRAEEAAFGNRPGTTGVTWLPLHHDMGLIGCVIQSVFSGMNTILMSPGAFIRRPRTWLELISRHRARISVAPNFGYALCTQRITDAELAGLDLSCWELAVCGAEPIQAAALRRFSTRFARVGFRADAFAPCYGLAESVLMVTATALRRGISSVRVDAKQLAAGLVVLAEDGKEIVACGAPVQDTHILIDDPDRKASSDGSVGEIIVRSPSVAAGYESAELESRATFTPEGLRTGDLGFIHGGQLYVVGRAKELLIIRGRKFHPHDIETAVADDITGLRTGRVIAGSFRRDDETPAVLVELAARSGDLSRLVSEIQTSVRRLFGVAMEAAILPKGSMHVTSSGKPERLRTFEAVARGDILPLAVSAGLERWMLDESDAITVRMTEPDSLILHELTVALSPVMRVRPEELDLDASLLDVGLDSLAAAELQAFIARAYEVDASMAYLICGVSLRSVALALEDVRARGVNVLRAPSQRVGTPSSLPSQPVAAPQSVRPSLFFFESTVASQQNRPLYADLERAVRFADEAGFEAVWLPERHFHAFGAPFPNPAVLAAALAVQTSRIGLRAGSVVLPLHHAARVAEEWAMVDRLSGGRVALSFASGWNPRDFTLAPGEFETRQATLLDRIDEVRALWRGESATLRDGRGDAVQVQTYPRPIQREVPVWLTCTERRERFVEAGQRGLNVLTGLLFQDLETLTEYIAAYRKARAAAGFDRGHVTLAVHAFIAESADAARATVRKPLTAYLESSVSLWKQRATALAALTAAERAAALEYATERYMSTSLIGSSEECAPRLQKFGDAGADEVACLIDFGVDSNQLHDGLARLAALWT